MIDRLRKWWPFLAVALVLLTWAGFSLRSCSARRQDLNQTAAAQQAQSQGIQHAAQGGAHDQEAASAGAAVAQAAKPVSSDKDTITRLTAERNALLAQLHALPVQPQHAGAPDPDPVALPPEVAETLAKDSELIQAQAKTIQDQDQVISAQGAQIISLTAARDSWRAAADDYQRQAAAERLAHEAAVSAARSERWVGRLEGFAVGAALGYVGGKL